MYCTICSFSNQNPNYRLLDDMEMKMIFELFISFIKFYNSHYRKMRVSIFFIKENNLSTDHCVANPNFTYHVSKILLDISIQKYQKQRLNLHMLYCQCVSVAVCFSYVSKCLELKYLKFVVIQICIR